MADECQSNTGNSTHGVGLVQIKAKNVPKKPIGPKYGSQGVGTINSNTQADTGLSRERWHSMDDLNNNSSSQDDYLSLAKNALNNFKDMTSSMTDLSNKEHRQSSDEQFPPPSQVNRVSSHIPGETLPPPPPPLPPPPPGINSSLTSWRTQPTHHCDKSGGDIASKGDHRVRPPPQAVGAPMFNLAQYAAEKALERQRKMQATQAGTDL
jgi:hypothetical protein